MPFYKEPYPPSEGEGMSLEHMSVSDSQAGRREGIGEGRGEGRGEGVGGDDRKYRVFYGGGQVRSGILF